MEPVEVNKGGRPRHYNTPKEFDDKVEEYAAYCKESKEPITWTGMALFMGFASRSSIDEYEKYDGFSYSVKRAKTLVEYHYEMRLCGERPTGAIFALKNFWWKDKTEIEMTTREELTPWGSITSSDDE